jgi:hypothetical protein
MRYRVFDFALDSDVALPVLPPASEPAALALARDPEPWRTGRAHWFHAFERPGESPWLTIGRERGALVLNFSRSVVLRYQSAAAFWWRDASTGDASFQHVVLDQALPLIAAHQGRTVLHAACAIAHGRALLFAGPAGAGKSTIAAALASHPGVTEVVGDDATALSVSDDAVHVRPAYAAVRLWPDTCAALGYGPGPVARDACDKRRFHEGTLPDDASRLKAIYVIESADAGVAPRVRDLIGREALIALVRNAYVLDPEDRARSAAHFESLSAIASRVPVRSLVVPRRFDALAGIVALLEPELQDRVRDGC